MPLKPCAKCGNQNPRLATSILWDVDVEMLVYVVICDGCKAMGPVAHKIEAAAVAWDGKQDFITSMGGS